LEPNIPILLHHPFPTTVATGLVIAVAGLIYWTEASFGIQVEY